MRSCKRRQSRTNSSSRPEGGRGRRTGTAARPGSDWVAFVIGFVVLLLARVVVSHLRRQTGLLDRSVWLAGMIDAFIPAVLGAALAAYPAHRYRPSKTGKDVSPG